MSGLGSVESLLGGIGVPNLQKDSCLKFVGTTLTGSGAELATSFAALPPPPW